MRWGEEQRERAREKENLFLKKDFIYLFTRDIERGRDIGSGRSRLCAGSLMWDSIPGPGIMPWAKGRRSTTEPPGAPDSFILKWWKTSSMTTICIWEAVLCLVLGCWSLTDFLARRWGFWMRRWELHVPRLALSPSLLLQCLCPHTHAVIQTLTLCLCLSP